MATACAHGTKLKATNVSAIVKNGHLLGHEALGPKERKPVPMEYEVLVYCQNPTCEKVFKAERKEATE